MQSKFTALTAIMALLILLAAPLSLSAQAPAYKDQQPTARLGDAEIDLFGPLDFQRVDGLDYDVDRRLSILHPASSESLAIFAEAGSWKPFFDEIFGSSPRDLAFYATISTAPVTSEVEAVSLSLEDISALLKLNELAPEEMQDLPIEIGETAVTPLMYLSHGPRFITFKTDLMEALPEGGGVVLKKRYLAIVSAIEVEGQMLFLNVFANRRGFDQKAEEAAVKWREAYLSKTRSLNSADQ